MNIPALGGNYEVVHHSMFLQELIDTGRIKLRGGGNYKGKRITYHDSCYLGRVNGVYEAPRKVLAELDADLVELKRCKENGLCCGAGGSQMFKEDEPGKRRINIERTEEVLESGAEVVASNCPFCMTMLEDGLKVKESKVLVYDLAELIVNEKL